MASSNSRAVASPAPGHDHQACVQHALQQAEEICARKGLRLTPIRRRVLELIWSSHRARKAYDLLAEFRAEQERAEPPTIYRALDFLQQAGLVHHLESLDAFVGCDGGACSGQPQFLICRCCGCVTEMTSSKLERELANEAKTLDFQAESKVIELHGLCGRCAGEQDTNPH